MTKNEEFDYYRMKYIKCLADNVFPWESAYYYYMQNIKRIDVLTFDDFKDDILNQNSQYKNEAGEWDQQQAFEAISSPMYDNMDQYYMPNELFTKDGAFVMFC